MSEGIYTTNKSEREDFKKLYELHEAGHSVASRELSKVEDGGKTLAQARALVERELSEDYLYLIRHENGFVKLGWTGDPERRLSELQKACPYQLRLETTIRTPDGQKGETILHDIAEDYHQRGEWYRLPERLCDLMGEWSFMDCEGRVVSDE